MGHFFGKNMLFFNHCALLPNFFLRKKLDASILDISAALGRSPDTLAGGEEEVTKEDNNRAVAAFTLLSRAAVMLDVKAGRCPATPSHHRAAPVPDTCYGPRPGLCLTIQCQCSLTSGRQLWSIFLWFYCRLLTFPLHSTFLCSEPAANYWPPSSRQYSIGYWTKVRMARCIFIICN